MRRRRGLGLLGTTAVAGGMYAAGRSQARGAAREQEQEARLAELERSGAPAPAYAPAPAPTAPPMPAPPAAAAPGRLEQLQQLSDLRSSGALTEQEFEAEKQRVLNS